LAFWLDLVVGLFMIASGIGMVARPTVAADAFDPAKPRNREFASLPRGNALRLIYEWGRVLTRKQGLMIAAGVFTIAFGLGFVWWGAFVQRAGS
jgi:uncharacterized membrane protein YfcA